MRMTNVVGTHKTINQAALSLFQCFSGSQDKLQAQTLDPASSPSPASSVRLFSVRGHTYPAGTAMLVTAKSSPDSVIQCRHSASGF